MTAEQLEAARAERMRQNGHEAITFEDVRTWIEETGLCIFLPRSTQAGQSILAAPTATPTFVEAVAGQPINEPSPELIATAESLLVRLEAEGVAVRLNLAGQPLSSSGDQPDYIVAGWVLPYIYALRGDRDWRRSPQLTGSRQVSQLAVQAAKHIDTANLTLAQIRDAVGREVTESAVLRALHELWKQLRIIPVVPEPGQAALWQPLRQRFQKAIAEGASTSQVTAISVLASIYLQAVIAASMEDIELFLSPLTSRSKIREVVRGLAATRQVHSTAMGHSPMFYVAGTLPEFPVAPSLQIDSSLPAYMGSSYSGSNYSGSSYGGSNSRPSSYRNSTPSYFSQRRDEELAEAVPHAVIESAAKSADDSAHRPIHLEATHEETPVRHKAAIRPASGNGHHAGKVASAGKSSSSAKAATPRPRAGRSASSPHPRDRNRTISGSRSAGAKTSGGASGSSRPSAKPGIGKANGNGNGNGHHRTHAAKPAHATSNGHAHKGAGNGAGNGHGVKHAAASSARSNGRTESRTGSRNGVGKSARAGHGKVAQNGASSVKKNGNGKAAGNGSTGARPNVRSGARPAARPAARTVARPVTRSGGAKPVARAASSKRTAAKPASRKPEASASKRYSFTGQAKQAPKPASKRASTPVAARGSKAAAAAKSKPKSRHVLESKRRG